MGERERILEAPIGQPQHVEHGLVVEAESVCQDTIGGTVKDVGHAASIMPASATSSSSRL